MQSPDEIAKLKYELSLLRTQQFESNLNFEQRLQALSFTIDNLSSSLTASSEEPLVETLSEPDVESIPSGNVQTISDLGLRMENGQLIYHQHNQPLPVAKNDNPQRSKSSNKSFITKQMASGIFEQFSELMLAPFSPLLSKLKAFYVHYQQRGLAAVFLMTVAGIITLTLGFTYLLQYSLTNWLSDIGKVCFAFIAANTLLALGVFIYKRRAQMQDFASGLVGLGLIINYISAYFSGPYFSLIPDGLSLLLLLIITVFGFFLSFKFETKVVAVLSLIGGSLAPMMLFNINVTNNQLIYLPYLLVIGGFAVLQSRLLRWPVLTEITAFLHIACVEIFIISQAIYFEQLSLMSVVGLMSINLMFYLYGFSGLCWLKHQDDKHLTLNTRLLVLPIALFAFTLLSMVQLSIYSGYIFLFNAVLFSAMYIAVTSHPALKVLALFLAGSFAGFSALQLLHQQLLGIVLLAEGLALLYLGCKSFYQSVRYEAYVLIVLGLISHLFALFSMMRLSPQALSNTSEYGFVVLYLMTSALALYTASHLLKLFIASVKHTFLEARILTVLRECLSINYIGLILYIAAIISFDYALNIIPLICVLLLYLAKKDKLKLSGFLAWGLLLPLAGLVVIGILDVGNTRFSMQPLYAQIARIELFACLIGFYYWYKHFHCESKAFKLARFFQVVSFFILPLIFLPKVVREYPDFLSLAAWLSVMISLPLAFFSRHRLLFFQTKVITVGAIIVTSIGCLMAQWQAILALTIAALMFAYLYHRYFILSKLLQLLLRFLWVLTPYYFGLVTLVAVHSLMSSFVLPHWGVVMAAVVVYFTQLLRIQPTPIVLRKSYRSCLLLLILPISATLLFHLENGLNLNSNSLLFMGAELIILMSLWQLFVDNGSVIRLLTKTLNRLYIQWCWQVLLCFCYLIWSYQFTPIVAAPLSSILLVIHGSCLMFVSLNKGQTQTIKLAGTFFALACSKVLLVDMAHFLIIQKMIAFMVIGGILLLVSYFYQKMKNSMTNSSFEGENHT